jgi:Cation efflux family
MPSYRQLQQAAILISILSILYNGVEGGVSIGFGADVSSKSLLFFGIQSLVEILSAILVVYRFRHVVKPGDENCSQLSPQDLRLEKYATFGIGLLFIILAATTFATSSVALSNHQHPDTALPMLIISASALGLMIVIWLPKVYLSKRLNSSAMKAEADCSLACIMLTLVLLGGSIIYRFWTGGWWVDGAVALLFGLYFAKDGIRMIRWARHPNFNGGCCAATPTHSLELSHGQLGHRRCHCCSEKRACKEAARCMCPVVDSAEGHACQCRLDESDGLDCCQKAVLLPQARLESIDRGVEGRQGDLPTIPGDSGEQTIRGCSDDCRNCS